jgi:uncharacterized protein YkwD
VSRHWLVVAVVAASPLASLAAPPGDGPDLAKATQQVIDQTNDFRRSEKLAPVKVHDKLTATARDFANFMANSGKYGHEADGHTPAERAQAQGYAYCLVAENIAYVYRSTGFATDELSKQFVEGWKNSPEHRKNMLDPDMTETGVAIARSETTGIFYAVQLFGRPKSLMIAFRIINRSEATVEYKVGDQSHSIQPRYEMTHQVCRPTDVTFQWPDSTSHRIRPINGDRYAIVANADGQLSVRKE